MTLSRAERIGLGLLLCIFTWFTWRGLTMFFSGDDMMNMYGAWDMNPWRIARAEVMLWMPVYRPLGTAIYRVFYAAFGFHPLPLYTFCWLLLGLNIVAAYHLFRTLTGNAAEALTALSLILVHGSFSDLYYSAGTIYDRLCFLFTVLGLIAYCRFRREPSPRRFALVCLSTILAMDSKESGVALPPLMLCLDVLFFRPADWKTGPYRAWIRPLLPLYTTLATLSLVFVAGRVNHTPELINPAYRPHASIAVWLTHIGDYFRILTYDSLPSSPAVTGSLLALMLLTALLTRSRIMAFGFLFFVISVTPVALITGRFGYVLYVPIIGLGLFLAELIFLALRLAAKPLPRFQTHAGAVAFVLTTIAITWFHARHWPLSSAFDKRLSPEWRLTHQFRQDYPSLPPGSKLLFVSDEFPESAWDLMFNIRLLYHDKSILVNRLLGAADQRPSATHPPVYDYTFAIESGRYVELDPRNPAESIRLNILRGYAVGVEMDMARQDHSAYVVSGLKDAAEETGYRWTDPHAVFKYQLSPAPAAFSVKYFLPDFVATPEGRTLSIRIEGKEMSRVRLDKAGMNEVRFSVPADLIRSGGYTFVEMNVDHPYNDEKGIKYGIVLIRAGFQYDTNQVSLPGPGKT